ncbi:MAG: beta-barrel assembly-enhancing protease [Acidobacteriota bacterium]|nr:beta-barrel assembly-enhancing protease [Acidobacteriota bacterium]
MNKIRIIAFVLILVTGIGLIILLAGKKIGTPLKATMAPAFENLGRPVDTVNRALTRVMPINSLDEMKFGEAIALRYQKNPDLYDEGESYLNLLIPQLAKFAVKPFQYRVFLIGEQNWGPNAYALPGGIILVTRSFLGILKSEAEIAAILAHEMGHIERSHCLNSIRFQLAAEKIDAAPLGELADFCVNFFISHAFSKTEENEADDYAFQLLLNTNYDPYAMADAFSLLIKHIEAKHTSRANVFSEYLMTHPYLDLREAKYREEARQWWENHDGETRTRGVNPFARVP